MSQSVKRVAIIGGNRIPFCRSNTAYFGVSNQDMLTAAIEGLVQRYQLQGQRLGEVVAGAVMKHSRDFNLTRETVLGTSLDPSTPCFDIQQACGTGLQAINLVANKIALGQIDAAIAGGVDTTSDAPIGVSEGLRKILLQVNKARSLGERIKPFMQLRPKDVGVQIPVNSEPRTGMSMGEHTEVTAKIWQIPRDQQDELAYQSHKNLAAAYDRDFFSDLVSPFNGVNRDNILRPETTLEKLATLSPAFDKSSGQGTLTAGNSSTLTDGASAVQYLAFVSEELPIPIITDFATRVAQPLVTSIPGVASVDFGGAQTLAMRIWVDPNRLAARGMSAGEVAAALRANNIQAAPGQLKDSETVINITAGTDASSIEEFRQLVIKQSDSGLVRLGDVATIELGGQNYDSTFASSGRRAISMAISPTPDGNPLESWSQIIGRQDAGFADALIEKIESMKQNLESKKRS